MSKFLSELKERGMRDPQFRMAYGKAVRELPMPKNRKVVRTKTKKKRK